MKKKIKKARSTCKYWSHNKAKECEHYMDIGRCTLTVYEQDDNCLLTPVNHPSHYNEHPSGVECIDIVEYFNFCIGNAIKYLWRAGLKHEDKKQDLEKAKWFIEREIGGVGKDEKTD